MNLYFIYGCMFSGKSKYIFDYIDRHKLQQEDYKAFKPSLHKRDGFFIKSRCYDKKLKCDFIDCLEDIKNTKEETIFIDEYQFLNKELLIDILNYFEKTNKTLIIVGLDKLFTGQYWDNFQVVYDKTPVNNRIQLFARCEYCGEEKATNSILQSENDTLIQLESELIKYFPACDICKNKK